MTAPSGVIVSYVFTITNPWGEPLQTIALTDPLPPGFQTSGPLRCETAGGAPTPTIPLPTTSPYLAQVHLNIGETLVCVLTGSFSSTGAKSNRVVAQNSAGYLIDAKVNTDITPSAPLGSDLAVKKTASVSSIDVSSGAATLTYDIIVQNNGPGDVFVGDHFKLQDRLSLLPNSVPLKVEFVSANCISSNPTTTHCLDPNDITLFSSSYTLVGTAGASPFFEWPFTNNLGNIAAGEALTVSITVRVEQFKELACIVAPGANGIRNTAFFTLIAANGDAQTEANPSNNTASVATSVVTGQEDISEVCGRGHLKVEKEQIVPNPAARLPWNNAASYLITIENQSVPAQDITIAAGDLDDWVTDGINTPPFTRVFSYATCTFSTDPTVCPALNGNFLPDPDFTYSFYGQMARGWETGASVTLRHGERIEIKTEFAYNEPDCETVPAAPQKPIINTVRVRYQATAFGAPSTSAPPQTFSQVDDAVTLMEDQKPCRFKVTKQPLNVPAGRDLFIEFGVPFAYEVTFTNNDAPRTIGTVMDAIRLQIPNYATSVNYDAQYQCSDNGGVSGYRPSGNTPPFGGAVYHTSSPAQGAQPFDFRANPANPIYFDTGGVLTCKIRFVLKRPPYGAKYCRSDMIRFQNTALMDVTSPFNPNIHWPPAGTYDPAAFNRPAPQDRNWAMADGVLPRCVDGILSKAASIDGLPAVSAPWTYAGGPRVDFSIDVTNTADTDYQRLASSWPWSGLIVTDVLNTPYAGASTTGQACTPPNLCAGSPTNPGYEIGLKSLAAGATGTWSFALPSPFQTGRDIENCAALNPSGFMHPSQGFFYTNFPIPVQPNDASAQSDCASVPVIRTSEIKLRKKLIDETGANITAAGPFEFTATCSPHALFAGTETISINAGEEGVFAPVPVRSDCSIAETAMPPVPQTAIDACKANGSDYRAEWTTSFSPDASLAANSYGAGVEITATNTLACTQVEEGEIVITKILRPVRNVPWQLDFQIDCTPTPAIPDRVTLSMSGLSGSITAKAPIGSTCTVTEVPGPFPQAIEDECAAIGQRPRWTSISYSGAPAQTIAAGALTSTTSPAVVVDHTDPQKITVIDAWQCVPERKVRIRNVETNQALYAFGGNVRHWGYWADPNMVYELIPLWGDHYRLRHDASNLCIEGNNNDGGEVLNSVCDTTNSDQIFRVRDIGGGEVRLESLNYGTCLYTPDGNGGKTFNFSCWADSNFAFVLEPA
ncbi:MAG: DUF5979 domain-containing protein [Pseudomonadota bacterium]